MSSKWKVGWLAGLVAASISVAGCFAPPGETGTAPDVKDLGTSSEMILPPSTITVIPSAPLPPYCVYSAPGVTQYFPAHYVEKIPNNWGIRPPPGIDYTQVNNPYNGHGADSRFADNYSVPFPTPWITAGSTQPDPHTYEQSLWWVPSTLWWQYLVHDVVSIGDGRYSDIVGHAYFMVPIPALSDYDRAHNLAVANAAWPVEARVNTCVRVVTRIDTTIYDTGESFLVYDEHDPRGPPN
jgi:hypothetical protein